MTQKARRDLLKFSLSSCATLLVGCGGATEDAAQPAPSPAPPPPNPPPAPAPSPSPSPSPSPPPAEAWNPVLPVFLAGTSSTFDLAGTLPGGVIRGGVFGVSSSGAALPTGMALSPSGVLSVGSAVAGQVTGVVFTYTEPAG